MANSPLEDLIRRYESGERNPDLIKQLNDAAWDGFHDPWETMAPLPTAAEHESSFDPNALLPFGTDTIQRFLDDRGYQHWKSSWNSFLLLFKYSERSDRTVSAHFIVAGKNMDIFNLRIECDRRVPAERFDRAFRLCNDWNRWFRWPMALVDMPFLEKKEGELEGREPASGNLALDFQLFFRAGVPQVLFNSMVRDAIDTSWDFWEKARNEYDL